MGCKKFVFAAGMIVALAGDFGAAAAPSGPQQVIVAHSKKCLDVAGVSTANGANVHQWQCLGASQRN